MAKQKKPVIGQLGLFPEAVKPQKTPGQIFAEKMHKNRLIPATIKRKRPKKGSPMTINVKKEIASAVAILRNVRGVNLNIIYTSLKSGEKQNVESLLKSGAINPIKRTPAEQRSIKNALNTITYFVNRNIVRKNISKAFIPKVGLDVEKGSRQRHFRSIGTETTIPKISEKQAKKSFWQWTKSVLKNWFR